jgi:predicted naringenin-chalcone synthase
MSLLLGAGGMQPPNCAAVVLGQLAWEIAVKYLPLLAVACVAALAACEYREQTTVRPAPAAAAVVTPAPVGAAVVTTPPASTTTVYTR